MIQSAARDDVEVVLDHDQRVAGGDQPAQRRDELRDVGEVQAGGRLVEQEQRAALRACRAAHRASCAGELQALRLAAGQRRHRLPERR